MPRYAKKPYQAGPFYLATRGESPAWYICWLDGRTVKRLSTGTADLEEAKAKLRDHYIRHGTPERQPPAQVTIKEVVERYFAQHGEKRPAAKWLKTAVKHWTDYFKDEPMADALKPDRLERFIAHMQDLGLKPSTIQNILTAGKAAVNRSWRRGEIDRPFFIPSIEVGEQEPKGRPMSVAEIAAWVDASAEHMKRLILLCLATASRPQAAAELAWSQIDFAEGLIHLNPRQRRQTKKHRPVVKLGPTLAAYLEGLERTGDNVVWWGGKSVRRYYRALQASRERADLDGAVNLYSLRHTAARWMRKEGVPPWEIAAQLGHQMSQKLTTTEIYAAYAPDYQEKATAALERLLTAVLASCATVKIKSAEFAKG